MAKEPGSTPDASSAPESGTDRDDTTGNQPSDRNNTGPAEKGDDPSQAGEEK